MIKRRIFISSLALIVLGGVGLGAAFLACDFFSVQGTTLVSLATIEKTLDEGNAAQAILYSRKRIRAYPREAASYLLLGQSYEDHGEIAKAVSIYETALRRKLEDPFVHFYLGRARYRQGRMDEAVAELDTFKGLVDPGETKARAAASGILANIYVEFEKDYRKAISELRSLADLDPSNRETRYQLGVAYAYSGQFQHAYREFQKIVDEDPKSEIAQYAESAIQYVRERRSPNKSFRVLADL